MKNKYITVLIFGILFANTMLVFNLNYIFDKTSTNFYRYNSVLVSSISDSLLNDWNFTWGGSNGVCYTKPLIGFKRRGGDRTNFTAG